ncbi:hypothetical protein [Vibrio sp. HN007]|uniref:hypothetical protein n=1 Tax=Vibrio iocasae TaxID=3098914 RepID=UPI0035D3ED73
MKRPITIIFSMLALTAHAAGTDQQAEPSQSDKHAVKSNDEKLADDPTKVVTKIGFSYSDSYDFDDSSASISGSLALDDARKINAKVNSDGSEWRIGGSWLFPIGIINFNFGKNEYANGATQTNYSVGTFVPLSYFGIEPAGFQIFPMAGYNYNDGDTPVCDSGNTNANCNQPGFSGSPSPENGFQTINNTNHGGYVGIFALRPLTEKWTAMTFMGTSYGSENDEGKNYQGVWAGLGASYTFNEYNSFNISSYAMDNNTYIDEPEYRIGISYTHEFN